MLENIGNIRPNDILSFLVDPPFTTTLLILKCLFISIFIFFLISIIYFLKKTHWMEWRFGEGRKEFLTEQSYEVKKISETWAGIDNRLKTDLESEYKLAIIEADGLLEEVLEKIGFAGKDFKERLEKMTLDQLPDIDKVKKVHEIRGSIIRDPDYRLSLDNAKKIIGVYREALESLEAFD